jgi:acetoin utilization protein AcuC
MNNARTRLFGESIARMAEGAGEGLGCDLLVVTPRTATKKDLRLFHTEKYIDFVIESSRSGKGYLDFPDTPSFPGVYEASLYTVGSTLYGLDAVLQGEFRHFFNPVGGLHHAARDRASGFCVFDGFESDPRVIIADIHEDGRSLFPGTGDASETGKGAAVGTKLNLPLSPGSGDAEFIKAFDKAYKFLLDFKPEFILLQCGADGLRGDPLTHLRYSSGAHAYAARRLHELAHETCEGRILAMGGGGYDAGNVDAAWSAVARELSGCS